MNAVTAHFRDELRQFRELSSLFFGRFVDNDLICLDSDTRGTLTGILALLAAPGLFLPFFEFIQFGSVPFCFMPLAARDLASFPDKTLHLALSMTVLGILTVLEWDAVLPDRRDYAVLRPLPLRMRTLFAAKIVALLKFWALFTLVINAVSVFFFPIAVVQNSPFATLAWYIRSHAIAVVAGNGFIFLAMIAAQGLLMNLMGWNRYRRYSPYAQSALVCLLLVMFFFSIGVAYGVRPGSPLPPLASALPPVWLAGLYQTELGAAQQPFGELAARAWNGLGLTTLLAALAYALSYTRTISQSFEQADGPAAAPGRVKRLLTELLNRALLRDPAQRASFHFVWNTVMRSRSHRVLVAAYAGAGFALVFQGLAGVIASGNRMWWHNPMGPLLPAPMILSLFILSGLRYAFTVPAELRANWVFQITAAGKPGQYLAGMRKAVVLMAVIPLHTVLLPVHVALWGWTPGVIHVLYGAIVAWLLMEVLLINLEKLPFTCSYVPGKANLKATWPLYVLGYLIYVSALTAAEMLILARPLRFVWFLLAAGAVKVGIEFYRRRLLEEEFALVFDERPAPAVQTLEILQ